MHIIKYNLWVISNERVTKIENIKTDSPKLLSFSGPKDIETDMTDWPVQIGEEDQKYRQILRPTGI